MHDCFGALRDPEPVDGTDSLREHLISALSLKGYMDFNILYEKVNLAVNKFYSRDSKLLEINSSEWAIAHRIAIYLETEFEEWNVDCEYTRMGDDGSTKHNTEGIYKRPDIIIHHRGKPEKTHNLLVIELKVNNSTENDYQKLRDFTSAPCRERPFQYQYGLALSLNPDLKMKWFPE